MAASGHHSPHHAPEHRGRRRGRPFDYGGLRLVVLSMIAEAPRHGYELMKAIEERTGGGYSPSPGVVYPTLSWLEDMGYAVAEAEGARKSFRITPEGSAFLEANGPALAELDARMGGSRGGRNAPEAVMSAMGDLKRSLRARFARGAVDEATAGRIAAALRAAAAEVEGSMPAGAALTSTATVTTPKAAGYAAQLANHFGHRIPARFEEGEGEIAFASGTCRLNAEGDRLTLTVEGATPEAIAQLQEVVASHLRRFAFRENLAVDWQPAPAA